MAVNNEAMFVLYEWILAILVVSLLFLSFVGMVNIKTKQKWIMAAFLAFTIQFSALCLFLGPFTFYSAYYVYYGLAFVSLAIYLLTIRKVDRMRYIPISFTFLTTITILYMMVTQSLWGASF
ncbi:hypothetical protein [Bacillus coahuilensis]|uniref:hypothetical protein n=1 Tax=Bacillus coahuilensis TaxID=408580 RepID=UPI0019D33BA3|nr:hypothetical protein [Bacillus coahuilensis]